MGISMNLKIFLTIGIVIYIYLTVKLLLKNDLQSSFLTFYFVSTIGLVVAIMMPKFIEKMTKVFGFETSSNMIFCITICILFYIVFKLTLKLSKEQERTVNLTQELSILKAKINKMEKIEGDKEDNK